MNTVIKAVADRIRVVLLAIIVAFIAIYSPSLALEVMKDSGYLK